MRTFFAQITALLRNAFFWTLDYIYVIFWQSLGLFRRGNARILLEPATPKRTTPIILIPGIYERWEFMKPLAQRIYEQGYPVHVIEGLGYNRGTVEAMSEIVHAYVIQQGLKDCVIVAHSKGGLIGKYLLAQHEAETTFRGMVTIATPFSGSKYAYLLPLRTIRIFVPNSPLLKLLAKNNRINHKIVSIYPKFDPHIPGGSSLGGAENIELPAYGHFRIIKSPRLHETVITWLDQFSQQNDK